MDETHQSKAKCQEKFIELRAQGWSLRKCANLLKRSTTTLSNWARQFELEIARLRAIELDSLYVQYGIVKESRLKALGTQIRAIEAELKGRKLSEVDTDKLLELLLRYLNHAIEEHVEPVLISDNEIARIEDKTKTKMDASEINMEIANLLLRLRAGLIDERKVAKELSILQGSLKALEQTELQEKIDRLTALIGGK